MDSTNLALNLLTVVGVRLPVLIDLTVGLVWTLDAPRGPVRTGALAGLLLLGAGSVVGMLLSVLPLWLVSHGNFEAVSGLGEVLGYAHFALGLLQALGMVLVVWALTRALRALPPAR